LNQSNRIFVAGPETLVGSAILRRLEAGGYTSLVRGDDGLNLADQVEVDRFFDDAHPEYVFMAGGQILGIGGNQRRPAELMLNNLLVSCHVIDAAHRFGVKKLLYLASGCSYPKECVQPMQPTALMTGPLEPTSEFYATAKVTGLKLCEAYRRQYSAPFIVGITANPFGPGDDFDLENAHVIGALIRRMHNAKRRGVESVTIWGTGTPVREFIFVEDLADACVFAMQEYAGSEPINLAGGTVITIAELAQEIKRLIGYEGALRFDSSKPDGMPLKMFDSTKLRALGWKTGTPFDMALRATYAYFLENEARAGAL
jgi:GDP-L-fucose synthase